MIIVTENTPNLFDQRHGGPFDRGAADSYYNRPMKPHFFVGASYSSEVVTGEKMTKEELYAYWAGYEWNEQFGTKKEW